MIELYNSKDKFQVDAFAASCGAQEWATLRASWLMAWSLGPSVSSWLVSSHRSSPPHSSWRKRPTSPSRKVSAWDGWWFGSPSLVCGWCGHASTCTRWFRWWSRFTWWNENRCGCCWAWSWKDTKAPHCSWDQCTEKAPTKAFSPGPKRHAERERESNFSNQTHARIQFIQRIRKIWNPRQHPAATDTPVY